MKRLLLDRGQCAKSRRLQAVNKSFSRPVISNGDDEIQIARETGLGAHGDSESADQGPRVLQVVEQLRNLP